MQVQKRLYNLAYIISVILILACSFILQNQLFLNWDVSHLLNVTQLWLQGGNYVDDFFTPNTPMIIFLYAPIVMLAKNSHITLLFPMYIYFLSLISFYICSQIIFNEDKLFKLLFLLTLLACYTITPSYHFGQRDQLIFVFIMPYILLLSARLQNASISAEIAFISGLLAAMAIAIKPQPILFFLMGELGILIYKKNWRCLLRVESRTIIFGLIVYSLLSYLVFPEYYQTVLPYMMTHYYQAIGGDWTELFFNNPILYAVCTTILFFYLYHRGHTTILQAVLFVALVCSAIIFFSQKTPFYYHLIPVLSFTSLLLITLIAQTVANRKIVLFGVFLFVLPLIILDSIHTHGVAFKKHTLQPLIAFIHAEPKPQSVYFLSEAVFSSPLIHYTNAISHERFDCLWQTEDLIKIQAQHGEQFLQQYIKNNHDPLFFINMIAQDLEHHAPSLIFVDIRRDNAWLSGTIRHFDYLKYFLLSNVFQKQWQHYDYLTTLDGGQPSFFKLAVYKRRQGI